MTIHLAQAKTQQVAWRQAAGGTAMVAAAVCLFMVTMLVLTIAEERRQTPLNSPQIAAMKQELVDRSNDEALKERIRQTDQKLRATYFASQKQVKRGAWLLVAAGAALALALKSYSTLAAEPPKLTGERPDTWQEKKLARLGVAVSAAVIVGSAGAWAVLSRPELPEVKEAGPVLPPAGPELLAKGWPSFRGFPGDGVVAAGSMPQAWDGAAGKGIAWKSSVPLPGHGSPVVFGGLVFLAGSDGTSQEVFAFDDASGQLKWRGSVPRGTLQNPNVFEDTGHAAATPVTDGVRVYAMFATGDLAAFDYSGKRLWNKNLGVSESTYGYAASLAMDKGNVIVQFDQTSDPDSGKSALLCFDGATGRQVWKTPRPVENSWSSPIVAGGRIYTTGNPWVIAYDATSGKEIWKAKLLEGDVAASPVFRDGVLYVANDRAVAAAIRADGKGDVTATHVLWTNKEPLLPDIVSPLTDGKRLLLTHGGGTLTCLDAVTGKEVWTHDVGGTVHASPVLVGDRVYLTSDDGVTHVFGLGAEFKELGAFPLGEKVSASPAVMDGRMFIRGKENLYCIK